MGQGNKNQFGAQFGLSGQTALITGSSRGIGLGLAIGLGEAGATIILNSRKEANLTRASDELEARGIAHHRLICDVTQPEEIKEAVNRFEADTGAIDILINNAGINHREKLEAFSADDYHRVMDTNCSSVYFTSQAVARHMLSRGRGKIITIASIMTLVARQNVSAYVTSKAAVAGLTRAMTAEWAERGLNINAIGPGYIKTELTQPLADDTEFSNWLIGTTPQRRWGEVSDLVGAAVFLASPASDFVNGQVIYVDGGMTATV